MSLSADHGHVQSLRTRKLAVSCRTAGHSVLLAAWGVFFFTVFTPLAWAEQPDSPSAQPLQSAADADSNEANSNEAVAEVVAPFPRSTSVTYPQGAEGDALVVLRFVVQADGSVRDVEVVLGDEPFASAAAAAALTWAFDPARRGTERLAVRIEFQVTFEQAAARPPISNVKQTTVEQGVEQEAQVPVGDVAPAASAPGGTAEALRQESAEVIVQEELPSGSQTLSREAARQVPGSFGDPLRAVDALPGVTPVVTGLPFYYVRGAPPANNGYYFDGIRLPFLYHAFLGPGAIHPEIIEAVHLYPGPYPARFGQSAGGIISADMRAPSGRLKFGADVGIYEAGGFAEIPFADGRGRIFLGGRYSYLAAIASLISTVKAEFWNYQALVDYALTPRDRIGVLFLGAYDLAERDGWWKSQYHRVDLRYDRRIGTSTVARLAATIGFDRTSLQEGEIFDTVLGARTQVSHRFSDTVKLDAGASISSDDYTLESFVERADANIAALFPSRVDSLYNGYAELAWEAAPQVTVVPGVRVDEFESLGHELAVSPTLTATYRLTEALQTTYGVGIAHQTPNYVPNVAGVRVAGLDGGLQRAVFTTAGIEARLPDDWVGSAAVFQNAIFDVTDVFGARQSFPLELEAAKNERALGRSYGLELSLRRSLTRRFAGLLSYTLSRTTRTYDDFETLSGSDRTHVLNLAGVYTFGANWRFGARSVLYSGLPAGTRNIPRLFDRGRAAPFFRIDLRAERRFRWGAEAYWSVVAEVQNATFGQEVLRRECAAPGDEGGCTDTVVGPIVLPNLKVEARF